MVLRLSLQKRRWHHTSLQKQQRGIDVLTKLCDFVIRVPLQAAALLLTQKAKMRAVCWGMRWLAKKALKEPIILEQVSEFGTVALKVTNSSAQLSWHLPPEEDSMVTCNHQPDETTEAKEESGRG